MRLDADPGARRSGDRIAIAAYLGGSDVFDRAIARFAASYADQNERDYQALTDAVKSGRIRRARPVTRRGPDLLLIGLGITLEPFPLMAFILVLSARKGIWKGLAFILGWLACLVAVIAAVILATGNHPPRPQTVPSTAALAVKLALGLVLILMAERQRRRMGRPRKPPAWMARLDRVSLWGAAGLAAFLQPWTLVAVGAATITQAKLATAGSYLALIGFCLLATSSFLYLELYATFAPARAVPGSTNCAPGSTRTRTRCLSPSSCYSASG